MEKQIFFYINKQNNTIEGMTKLISYYGSNQMLCVCDNKWFLTNKLNEINEDDLGMLFIYHIFDKAGDFIVASGNDFKNEINLAKFEGLSK